MYFKRCVIAVGFTLALCSSAAADPRGCQNVLGGFSEFVITPFGSPNDPLGRVVLTAHGTINAVGTAILTTVGPGPTPGTLGATTRHVFLVSEEDQLTATGVAVFTPIPGTTNVTDLLTLTITGGTGKFANATGTIVASGIGLNFFPLPPGPSSANNSSFHFTLSGQICGVE
jgi:hypothetical protein